MTTTSSLWSSFRSLWNSNTAEGESAERPLHVTAVPGFMTVLDTALFRAVEPQLTATLTSSHALLAVWIQVQQQARLLLRQSAETESRRTAALQCLARACLDAANDTVEKLSCDKLAASANLTDPYPSASTTIGSYASGGGGSSTPSGGGGGLLASHSPGPSQLQSVLESSRSDTGRRRPLQRPRDCWETARLLCTDFVWADAVVQAHARVLKQLSNLLQEVDGMNVSSSSRQRSERSSSPWDTSTTTSPRWGESLLPSERLLQELILTDLPARLTQFKASVEADSVVLKRLYLVKCELRAPFRAFLEGHVAVQRAPALSLVDEYLELSSKSGSHKQKQKQAAVVEQRRTAAKARLTQLLSTPALVQALALERQCEEFELEMAKALWNFTELARWLENQNVRGGARLQVVPGVLDKDDLAGVQETVRRLSTCLCRKTTANTTGIRSLLLDWQGVPRDDEMAEGNVRSMPPGEQDDDAKTAQMKERLAQFLHHLSILGQLCETHHAFRPKQRSASASSSGSEVPTSLVRGCTTDFDTELFSCQYQDWYALMHFQQQVVASSDTDGSTSLEDLADEIRLAEMEVSIAAASPQSLQLVRQRLEVIATDRERRFQVLRENVEEVCLREMNLYVSVDNPDPLETLKLQPTSALGVFGLPLQMAGEPLPIG